MLLTTFVNPRGSRLNPAATDPDSLAIRRMRLSGASSFFPIGPYFRRKRISVVIRLFWRLQFVDPAKIYCFAAQRISALYSGGRSGPFCGKTRSVKS
jgi:hypothetical protein